MSSPPSLRPILAALLGVAAFSLMDAFMKGASLAIGAYSAALLRSALGVCLIAPVWLARGGRWPARRALRFHLVRGVVSAFMALSFFFALTRLPLAETIAISFFAPILSLYLAAIVLKETIRPGAIVAGLFGLAGTLVIVGGRIGREALDDGAAAGLAAILFSALLYAYNLILARQQAQHAGPLEIASFHSGVGALVLAIAAPWLLVLPDMPTLGAIGAASLLTVIAATLLGWANAREEAQVLVAMEYSGFLWAALFGWLFFAETVTPTVLMGTLLIVIGCAIATRRSPRPR